METLRITTRAPRVAQVTMTCPAVFNAFDEAPRLEGAEPHAIRVTGP